MSDVLTTFSSLLFPLFPRLILLRIKSFGHIMVWDPISKSPKKEISCRLSCSLRWQPYHLVQRQLQPRLVTNPCESDAPGHPDHSAQRSLSRKWFVSFLHINWGFTWATALLRKVVEFKPSVRLHFYIPHMHPGYSPRNWFWGVAGKEKRYRDRDRLGCRRLASLFICQGFFKLSLCCDFPVIYLSSIEWS